MEIRNHVYHFSVEPKLTGKRIKELRKDRNMTAQNLADALLCSVKTVSSWETGARFPSIDNLVDLSNFFDVSVHSLMLPLDNCPEIFEDIRPDDELFPNCPDIDVRCSLDEDIAALLTRNEYLLQRLLAKVFTKENNCELLKNIVGLRLDHVESVQFDFKIENTSDAFWKFKKSWIDWGNMRCIIFNRILHGDNLAQSLQAMDLFERSVFLTVLCYFSELRTWDCAKTLFENGARFIDCEFQKRFEEIQAGAEIKEQGYLFNIAYHTFEEVFGDMEAVVERFLATAHNSLKIPKYSEDPSFYEQLYESGVRWYMTKNNEPNEAPWGWVYVDVTDVVKYSESPELYKKKKIRVIGGDCKDPKERKVLGKYYYLFGFVADAIKTPKDLEQRMVSGSNDFERYINELIERGLIVK